MVSDYSSGRRGIKLRYMGTGVQWIYSVGCLRDEVPRFFFELMFNVSISCKLITEFCHDAMAMPKSKGLAPPLF